MNFENHVTIRRSRDEVFNFIADFRHMPLWNYYVIETQQLTQGAPAVGTRYFQRRKKDEQHLTITEYQPNHLVAIQVEGFMFPVQMRFTFEDSPQGTEVVDEWRLWSKAPLPQAIAQRITRPIQQAVAENLGKLKQLLESGQTDLQDGRVTRLD